MPRTLRELLKKQFPADGLGWKIPSFVAALIAIVGGVVAVAVWASDALADFLTADVEVWHLLLAIGAQILGGLGVAVVLMRRSASRELPARRKVVPYPEEVEHFGVIWPISTLIVGGTPEFSADKPACPKDRSTLGMAVGDPEKGGNVVVPLGSWWREMVAERMRFGCFKDDTIYDLTEYDCGMETALEIVEGLAEGEYRTALAAERQK